MKTKLVLIGIILLLFSCSRKYCTEKYPYAQSDSIAHVEVVNIDTIYIPMFADTVKIESKIDCPDQKVLYRDGKIEYKLIIKDKILTLTRISAKDSLRLIYAYKNTEEFKKLAQVKIVPEIQFKVPKWAWCSLIANIVLLVWITRKIWSKFIRFPI